MEDDRKRDLEGAGLVSRPFLLHLRELTLFYRVLYEAIEKHTRARYGYASILQVDILPVSLKDEMPRSVKHGSYGENTFC